MGDNQPNATTPIVVGFGEALFDRIRGEAILGGAPINFSVHVRQLLGERGRVAVVSRVGRDNLGRRLRSELAARSVETDALQEDPQLLTGVVEVQVDAAGQPSYDICCDVAWDEIEFTPALADLATNCSAVCYGTLVQRTATSRATLYRFLAAAVGAKRVCDLNVRQHYYDAVVLEESLKAASILKINDEELAIVCRELGVSSPNDGVDRQCQQLAKRFKFQAIALTRGARGTVLYRDGERFESPPPALPFASDADGVGAGDGCCAAIVCGLLDDLPPAEVVRRANLVGAYVASQRGATPSLPPDLLTAA